MLLGFSAEWGKLFRENFVFFANQNYLIRQYFLKQKISLISVAYFSSFHIIILYFFGPRLFGLDDMSFSYLEFLPIYATVRSKISFDQTRIQFGISLDPLFFCEHSLTELVMCGNPQPNVCSVISVQKPQ